MRVNSSTNYKCGYYIMGGVKKKEKSFHIDISTKINLKT